MDNDPRANPSSSGESEEDVLRDARAGSRSAFERITEKHRRDLLRYAASRIGPVLRGRLEPEDIVQDTLLKAYQGLDRFQWKGPESLGRWLRGIAEHLIRNAARNGGAGGAEIRSISLEPASQDPSPSRQARREERFERLQEALRHLSPEHREAIECARIRAMSIRQIAERMGRSEGAVKKLLARALEKLRDRFGDTVSLGLPARILETDIPDSQGKDEGQSGPPRPEEKNHGD